VSLSPNESLANKILASASCLVRELSGMRSSSG